MEGLAKRRTHFITWLGGQPTYAPWASDKPWDGPASCRRRGCHTTQPVGEYPYRAHATEGDANLGRPYHRVCMGLLYRGAKEADGVTFQTGTLEEHVGGAMF